MHTYPNKVVHLHIHGHKFSLKSEAKHLFASQVSVQNSTGKEEMFAWWDWVGSSRLWQWVEGLMQHFFLSGSVKYGFKQKLVVIISNV